jgi:hypothetical protein
MDDSLPGRALTSPSFVDWIRLPNRRCAARKLLHKQALRFVLHDTHTHELTALTRAVTEEREEAGLAGELGAQTIR